MLSCCLFVYTNEHLFFLLYLYPCSGRTGVLRTRTYIATPRHRLLSLSLCRAQRLISRFLFYIFSFSYCVIAGIRSCFRLCVGMRKMQTIFFHFPLELERGMKHALLTGVLSDNSGRIYFYCSLKVIFTCPCPCLLCPLLRDSSSAASRLLAKCTK